jgi:hypothetical protein
MMASAFHGLFLDEWEIADALLDTRIVFTGARRENVNR